MCFLIGSAYFVAGSYPDGAMVIDDDFLSTSVHSELEEGYFMQGGKLSNDPDTLLALEQLTQSKKARRNSDTLASSSSSVGRTQAPAAPTYRKHNNSGTAGVPYKQTSSAAAAAAATESAAMNPLNSLASNGDDDEEEVVMRF
jgi:hypothetical protein